MVVSLTLHSQGCAADYRSKWTKG